MTRASAGTRSPARSSTTSPGTRSRAGTAVSSPSRSTCAVGRRHLRSASSARARAVFLDEAEQHGEQHDDGDDDRLERVAEESGDDAWRRGESRSARSGTARRRCARRDAAQRLQLVRAVDVQALRASALARPVSPVARCRDRACTDRPTAYARRERCPTAARIGLSCCRLATQVAAASAPQTPGRRTMRARNGSQRVRLNAPDDRDAR